MRQVIRKRSFLLFELLISLLLISMCLLPLLKPHVWIRREEVKSLIEMQLERAHQTAFCQLKQELWERFQPSWESLENSFSGRSLDHPFFIWTGEKEPLPFSCIYSAELMESIRKPSQSKNAMVVRFAFTFLSPKQETFGPYCHTLYLEQLLPPSSPLLLEEG